MPLLSHPAAFRQHAFGLPASQRGQDGDAYVVKTVTSFSADSAPHSSHPPLPHLTLLVFEAVLEVICVSLPGYLAAHQGFFNSEMQKFTANLNVALFTPCLIFVKLASKLTADKLVDLATIPAIFLVQTLVSWLCAMLMSKIFGFSRRPRNFVIAMGVFGNSNSLPISLVISLSQTISGLHWAKIPNDSDEEVQARGILYLLIFQQLGQLVRWSWGYNVLLAPRASTASPDRRNSLLSGDEHSAVMGEHARLLDTSDASHSDDAGTDEARLNPRMKLPSSDLEAADSPLSASGDRTPILSQQNPSPYSSTDSVLSDGTVVSHLQRNLASTIPGSRHGHGSKDDSIVGNSDQGFTSLKHVYGALARLGTRAGRLALNVRKSVWSSIRVGSAALFNVLPTTLRNGSQICGRAFLRACWGFWGFMNPPLWAMLAAIFVASIPDLQRLFFTDGTFIKNSVTTAIDQSAGVAVPLILVVLGGNLARSTQAQEESDDNGDPGDCEDDGLRLLLAALLSRMLLPFLIMGPILALTAKYLPISIFDDPIFVIVCFLITGAPSALQLAQICQINDVYMKTMSRLLFQSYVVWILPSTLVLVMSALEVVEWAKGI